MNISYEHKNVFIFYYNSQMSLITHKHASLSYDNVYLKIIITSQLVLIRII